MTPEDLATLRRLNLRGAVLTPLGVRPGETKRDALVREGWVPGPSPLDSVQFGSLMSRVRESLAPYGATVHVEHDQAGRPWWRVEDLVTPWTPMMRCELNPARIAEVVKACRDQGVEYDPADIQETWANDLYTALVRRMNANHPDAEPMVWISFHRHDRAACSDWRHKQRIKNDLVGPECEAMEIFPAESRLVDSANSYHLFAFTRPGMRMGLGYDTRDVGEGSMAGLSRQRPFHPADRPADCQEIT